MVSHRNLCYAALQTLVTMQEVAKVTGPVRSKLPLFIRYFCSQIDSNSRTQPSTLPTPEGVPVGLCFLPMYHSAALHAYILRSFLVPQTVVIMSKYNVNLVLDYIPRFVPLFLASRFII